MIRLTCPICGTAIVDGREPLVGERCEGCGASLAGGGEDPISAVAAALYQRGHDDLPVDRVAQALFALSPTDPLADLVAITSDERDGFYRWWLLLRDDERDVIGELLGRDAAGG